MKRLFTCGFSPGLRTQLVQWKNSDYLLFPHKVHQPKTWNVFTFQILEKSISNGEDRTLKIYFCPELGVSNEKCGGQNKSFDSFASTLLG